MEKKTFWGEVDRAKQETIAINPADLKRRMAADDSLLIIDVRDMADIKLKGTLPGVTPISLGTLIHRADPTAPEVLQHPELSDFARPIVTTCTIGALAAMGAKLLQEMGYTDVKYVSGGTNGWKEAGFEAVQFSG